MFYNWYNFMNDIRSLVNMLGRISSKMDFDLFSTNFDHYFIWDASIINPISVLLKKETWNSSLLKIPIDCLLRFKAQLILLGSYQYDMKNYTSLNYCFHTRWLSILQNSMRVFISNGIFMTSNISLTIQAWNL